MCTKFWTFFKLRNRPKVDKNIGFFLQITISNKILYLYPFRDRLLEELHEGLPENEGDDELVPGRERAEGDARSRQRVDVAADVGVEGKLLDLLAGGIVAVALARQQDGGKLLLKSFLGKNKVFLKKSAAEFFFFSK